MAVLRDLFRLRASFRAGAILLGVALLLVLLSFVSPYDPADRRVVPKDRPPRSSTPWAPPRWGRRSFGC